MKEGLMKNTSLTAVAVAAGMLLSVGSAFAADLGGNCCADLEERVAELEATTARKGTRKTSLEIWGQVNKAIVVWDDGHKSNTVFGSDNVNASTRFGFRGNAKIRSDLSAGYSIVVEWNSGGRSTNIGQTQDKGLASGLTPGAAAATAANSTAAAGSVITNNTGFANFGANDPAITMREANWWIESTSVGRLTVGRFVGAAGVVGMIDVSGNIGSEQASGSMSLIGTALNFRTNGTPAAAYAAGTGNVSRYTIGNTTDGAGEYGSRQNGIMWTSPTLAGFTVGASFAGAAQTSGLCANATCTGDFGNEGPFWSANIKYANEFNGVRLAAALGYENAKGEAWTSMATVNQAPVSGIGAANDSTRPASTNWGVSLSLMHVATGLFAQGYYNEYTRGHDSFDASTGAASVYAAAGFNKDTAKQWMIQSGISRNWFGVGATTLYGEYGQTKNGFNTIGLESAGNAFVTGVAGGVAYSGDVTNQKMWGLGISQSLDAAAMNLYLGYRNFSISSDNCAQAGGCKDIGMLTTGARIRF